MTYTGSANLRTFPGGSLDTLAAKCFHLFVLAAVMAFQPVSASGDARSAIQPLHAAREASSVAPSHVWPSRPSGTGKRANFGKQHASVEVTNLVSWIVDSADNKGMPFMVIDKVNATVMMFDASGQLQGAAPALLGLARGDDSTPGIGQRKLSSIRPDERTTPAGRFVASLDRDINGKELLWVDYDTAIALHPVVKGTPAERRGERLDSANPDDNRISYGCINVPPKFYELFVSSAFTGTSGIVYILPETRTAQEVFGSYEVKNPSIVAAKP